MGLKNTRLSKKALIRQILDREDGIFPYIHKRTNTVKIFHKDNFDIDNYSIMIEEELGVFDYDALEYIIELQREFEKNMLQRKI